MAKKEKAGNDAAYFFNRDNVRIRERKLPINEIDNILPIYDTDGRPFEESHVINDVEGMTAAPSDSTVHLYEQHKRHEHTSPKYYNPEDYVDWEEEFINGVSNRHQKWKKEMRYKKKEIKQRERALRRKQKLETKVGVYPISGRKPFITNEFMVEKKIRKNKLSEDDFTYTDIKGFAYAVATRAIESYNLGDMKASKLEGLVKDESFLNQIFVKDFRRNHYNLPEQHLAMDILLCLKYCKDEFEKYVGGLAGNLYKLSIIQHERIKKRTPEDIERRADQLLTPLYQKKK